jgi:hypothetical protein
MNRIFSSAAELYLSFKFRKDKVRHNIFNKFISNSKNVLLLAGDTENTDNYYSEIIRYFIGLGKNLTIILPSNEMSHLSNLKNVRFITYNPIDISFYGLPKQKFLQELDETKYDTIIDLSLKSSLFNNYIIKYFSPDFTVGFEKNNSDKYYNFQVKAEINSENSYRNLLNSIRMF